MLDLIPDWRSRRRLRVLCIGAHCDDIEIGCGGTLLALQRRRQGVAIEWLVLSGDEVRRAESLRAMGRLVRPPARAGVEFCNFGDGRLPAQYGDVKDRFEALKRVGRTPDLILCHERDDRHQDHRLVNEMCWNTFRDQLVLEYEIPKWDGGLGQPNVYVPLSRAEAATKVRTLLEAHRSQARRDWFTAETFLALLRLRGIECRSPSGYAEGFHGRKLRLITRR